MTCAPPRQRAVTSRGASTNSRALTLHAYSDADADQRHVNLFARRRGLPPPEHSGRRARKVGRTSIRTEGGVPTMKNLATRIALLVFTLLAAHGAHALAQDKAGGPPAEELGRTLAAQDAALFDSFNRCELEKFAAFFVEDVEFYHDKGGVTLSRKSVVESVRNNICGKVRREAVADSFEAYPIPGFGAVQMGTHRFYELSA